MSDNSKIDENDVKTWVAYNETTGLVEPLRVDPVTGALLCYGVSDTGGTFTDINNAKIDQNDVKTKIGYNEDTNNIEAFRCGASGELLVKIVT